MHTKALYLKYHNCFEHCSDPDKCVIILKVTVRFIWSPVALTCRRVSEREEGSQREQTNHRFIHIIMFPLSISALLAHVCIPAHCEHLDSSYYVIMSYWAIVMRVCWPQCCSFVFQSTVLLLISVRFREPDWKVEYCTGNEPGDSAGRTPLATGRDYRSSLMLGDWMGMTVDCSN